jgi:hypothetical protein
MLENLMENKVCIISFEILYLCCCCAAAVQQVDLKILKLGYLSNHLLDHTQILNLSFNYQK